MTTRAQVRIRILAEWYAFRSECLWSLSQPWDSWKYQTIRQFKPLAPGSRQRDLVDIRLELDWLIEKDDVAHTRER